MQRTKCAQHTVEIPHCSKSHFVICRAWVREHLKHMNNYYNFTQKTVIALKDLLLMHA